MNRKEKMDTSKIENKECQKELDKRMEEVYELTAKVLNPKFTRRRKKKK
ncbi:MAG: hypothetical protein WBB86_07465 [Candidatus Omnitrophota bacterium]